MDTGSFVFSLASRHTCSLPVYIAILTTISIPVFDLFFIFLGLVFNMPPPPPPKGRGRYIVFGEILSVLMWCSLVFKISHELLLC